MPFEPSSRAGGPPGGFAKKKDKDGLRVNREIRAPQIRVIDDDGSMLGVMSVPEGLRLAEARGLDLLEIAPQSSPPTCRIMDYGKWKYENKKKAAAARKKQVIVTIKEIQLRPRTDQHDLDTKLRHARRFLLEGDKVKVNLRFSGREMAHRDLGIKLLQRVSDQLKELAILEVSPKLEGRQMFLIVAPDPLKVKDYQKKNMDNSALVSSKDEAERSQSETESAVED
ncbi:MAG: translation initiation factor IF-3 [Bdellovibrio sp.]